MVCQAHVDPVWLWAWEDGLTEAISTFRIACDFCERVKGFVFCHNEAILYRWVEEHDPDLFQRIRRLVKAGRWHIAGGSWLQPDLNLTSGESHIRQFLLGKAYFQKTFGVVPTTAYNFDSFGQPAGYAQILAGCGFDSYIFCRPSPSQWPLPIGPFRWRDRSGREIVTRRSDDHYGTRHNAYEKISKALHRFVSEPVSLVLWGIGNHGGGPSREDLKQIERFAKEHPEYELIHSTPEAFFAEARKGRDRSSLPVVAGEMQNCYAGCYTSMRRVKHAHRACENLMAATERLAAMAWWRGTMPYPAKELDAAWKDILFGEFHDILPGSGTTLVEKDALALFGHCSENLRRVRIKAFLSLLQGEKPAPDETTPLFVWNPHSFAVNADVECEFAFSHLMIDYGEAEIALHDGHTGRPLAFQRERASHPFPYDFRVKVAVPLRLKPFEIRRMDATWTRRPKPMPWRAPGTPKKTFLFKGRKLRVRLNMRTGFVDWLGPSGARSSFLRQGALRPTMWPDLDHAWESGDPQNVKPSVTYPRGELHWRKPSGAFRLATRKEAGKIVAPPGHHYGKEIAPIRIIEDGPVRTVVEAVFVMNQSAMVRRYVLSTGQDWLEVRDRIFWNERDTLLKVALSLAFEADGTISEAPYSAMPRPVARKHVDQVHQRWVAATEEGKGRFVAVLNDGLHAHSLWRNTLYCNILRSPSYACFGLQNDRDAESLRAWLRHDQGEHEVRYRIVIGRSFSERRISRAAQAMNLAPQWIIHHPGPARGRRASRPTDRPFIAVSPANVHVAALKKAERGNGLVVRLWEQSGRKTTAELRLGGISKTVRTTLEAYGLKTLILQRKGKQLLARETNLTES